MIKEFKTYWSTQAPPWGAFDDLIKIESLEHKELFCMRPPEFEFMISQLFSNWKNSKSKYIQILREWNECKGFNDLEEKPSIISDIEDTIYAIQLVQPTPTIEYLGFAIQDWNLLLDFLQRNQNTNLTIWKDY